MILVFDKKKILNCFIVKDYWVICWFKLMIEVNVCLFRKKWVKICLVYGLWMLKEGNILEINLSRNK